MKHCYSRFRFPAVLLALLISGCVFAQQQFGWIQKSGFPGDARHRASGAGVGNRGYWGLGHINSVVDILYDDWWEYDPGSDTWMQKASYPGGLRMHAATFVINNQIYVGTGRDQNVVLHQDFWKYDPPTNTWTSVAPFPGQPRRGAVGFAINGFGYVGTGSNYASFYKYNPTTDSWSQISSLPPGGRMSAVGWAINGKGYVGTGDDGGPTNDLWEYDPQSDSWTQKANLPGLARMEAGGFAFQGKGYIGTGDDFSSGTNYQDFWCYDPVMNSWTQVADFGGAARRYLCSFVINNRAYAGLGTSGINYADLWEFGTISGITEENATAEMKIFPNPVVETATVQLPSAVENADVTITDLNGREVRNMKITGSAFLVSREELAAGTYWLSVTEKEGKRITAKIIFQ